MKPFLSILTCLTLALPTQAELSKEIILNTARSIDEIIDTQNAKKDIKPNLIADDSTFVRRAYLNISGRIPTLQEAKTFLDSTEPDKRHKLIDTLVDSKGFQSSMFNFYANLLRLQTNQEQFGLGWHVWLREQVDKNTPYDKIVYQMLAAYGHTADNPAVGYYLRDRGMLLDNISNTSKVFLGTEIGCAQCHDHPFEDWTQKQYYQLAAFGSSIDYKSTVAKDKIREVIKYKNQGNNNLRRMKPNQRRNKFKKEARGLYTVFRDFRKNEISLAPNNTLNLPDDYQYNDGKPGDSVTPKILFGKEPQLPETANRLDHMAAWVTARSNPMFTKVIANRLWKHAMGYGLVEPDDAWTHHSNISHPEVLDALVKILHTTNFDTKETLRVIYHTSIFQLETCANDIAQGATHDFRGPLLRRMSAEEIHDSLLTLEKGNMDEKTNPQLVSKWENFKHSIHKLLDLKPTQLITLADASSRAEAQFRKIRTELSALKTEEAKLRGAGEYDKANKTKSQLNQLQRKAQQIRRGAAQNADPEMASMMNMRNLRTRSKTPLRASEMASPYRPGSFLRDFGASDRETTNSQHTQASIPQALALLNGHELDQITDNKGALPTLLQTAKTDEEKLQTLFLAIYSQYPTGKDKARYLPQMETYKDIQTLAKAMIASKRFLFIQ